jgi:hypothetical protein
MVPAAFEMETAMEWVIWIGSLLPLVMGAALRLAIGLCKTSKSEE